MQGRINALATHKNVREMIAMKVQPISCFPFTFSLASQRGAGYNDVPIT